MNVKQYQDLTRVLNKALHRISLCIKKSTISEALVEWSCDEYSISLAFELEDSSIYVSVKGEGTTYKDSAKDFLDNLISKVQKEVSSCQSKERESTNDWDQYHYIDENSDNLVMKTSFEMLLSSLKDVYKDSVK